MVLRCHCTQGSIIAPTSWLNSTWMSAGKGLERHCGARGGGEADRGEERRGTEGEVERFPDGK